MQSHIAVEERDLRRLPEGLLERKLGLARRPVLVVALRGQVNVEAASTPRQLAIRTRTQRTSHSSSWIAQGRPSAKLVARSSATSTLQAR